MRLLARLLVLAPLACGSRSPPPQAEPVPAAREPPSGPDAAPGQSFAEGIRAFCEAPARVKAELEAEPSRKATILALEVRRSVTNEEAKAAIAHLGALAPEAKDESLRDLLARAGVERCPIVEALGAGEPK